MITTSVTNTYKFMGLSTETKPKGPAVGSIFEETDTGDTFFYNGKRWVKLAEEESGGGAFCVTFTLDDSGEEIVCTVDKTFSEIKAAYDAGKFVYGRIDEGDGYYMSLSLSEIGPELLGFERMTTGSTIFLIFVGVAESDGDTVVNYQQTEYDLSSLIVEP